MARAPLAYSNVPVPDPSLLTTDQLRRELSALKESLEIRLSAMDKATELLNTNATRVPTDTDKQISHLKELHDEKFSGIEKQFNERDVRAEASENAAKVAVNAALQAQKEAAAAQNESNAAAITKSEVATNKAIDGIMTNMNTNVGSINDKIVVINGRLDRNEGRDTGRAASIAMIVSISAVLVSLIGLGVNLLGMRGERQGPSAVLSAPLVAPLPPVQQRSP